MTGIADLGLSFLGVWGKVKDAANYLILHPLFAVALGTGAFALIERHEAHHWERVAHSTESALATCKGDNLGWAKVHLQEHGNILDLTATLQNQTKAIRAWSAAAQARQDAAKVALRTAQEHARGLEASAAAMEAESGAEGASCRSGDAVMRGGL